MTESSDRWTGTPWKDYYEGGRWNRDGGNLDSLAIMVQLFSELLGSPLANELNHLGKWRREGPHVHARHSRIIDYGCAEGDGTVFLRAVYPFADIKGVDIWPGAIEKARKRWTERDVVWEVGDVTNPVERCDLAISTTTVDHVEDVGGCIERLRKWSKWVVVQWGFVPRPGHPSQDRGWEKNCGEPFWSKKYLQPRLWQGRSITDSFEVNVWRGL